MRKQTDFFIYIKIVCFNILTYTEINVKIRKQQNTIQ